MSDEIELSIVMPCLDEAETLAACIRKARLGLGHTGARGMARASESGRAVRRTGGGVLDHDASSHG
jgi:hypothetical protein